MKYHVHIGIKNALTWPDKKLTGMLEDSDGKTLTPDEVREFFIAELRKGYDCWSPCDNRKSDGTCAGHETEGDK